MASVAFNEGPKTLSFAPIRASKTLFKLLSWASGPTKGTEEGSFSTIFVYFRFKKKSPSRINKKDY